MTPIQVGSESAFKQGGNFRYNPSSGTVDSSVWSSHSEAAILALRNAATALGLSNSYRYDNGSCQYVLELDDTSGTYVLDTWQIRQNELQVPAWKNPLHLVAGAEAAISEADLNRIANLRNGVSVDGETATTYGDLLKEFSDAGKTRAYRLLQRIYRGEEYTAKSGYVCVHTTNISADNGSVNVADLNIGRIYTMAAFLAEATNPSLWTNPMGTRMAQKLLSLSADAPPSVSNYLWGWLKRGSTESTAADNRIDITTEWWLEQWSTDEYQAA